MILVFWHGLSIVSLFLLAGAASLGGTLILWNTHNFLFARAIGHEMVPHSIAAWFDRCDTYMAAGSDELFAN